MEDTVQRKTLSAQITTRKSLPQMGETKMETIEKTFTPGTKIQTQGC